MVSTTSMPVNQPTEKGTRRLRCTVRRPILLPSALVVVLIVTAIPASAKKYTQEDILALPRVCLAQKFINHALRVPVVPDAERAEWAARLGPDYSHFHHFCWALVDLSQASRASTAMERRGHFKDAIQNFEYVQRNCSPTFPLLPEVYLRKGLALRQMGDDGGAAREFLGAMQLKRDYTPAYSALIDLYIDLGDYEEANNTLQLGLRVAPDSKILLTKKADVEKNLAAQR